MNFIDEKSTTTKNTLAPRNNLCKEDFCRKPKSPKSNTNIKWRKKLKKREEESGG